MNVLFIGNSHTYLHEMPQMLVELAHAGDSSVQLNIDQITGEGAGFLQKMAYETVLNAEVGIRMSE